MTKWTDALLGEGYLYMLLLLLFFFGSLTNSEQNRTDLSGYCLGKGNCKYGDEITYIPKPNILFENCQYQLFLSAQRSDNKCLDVR